ncbi:ImmA/IrrE family metallo-endopeptidase [Cytobacillus sp. FSL H8-0458]|uniref:ImmA/IrrE family metallo-endopeptidase n=1 Tax=Cytobacillus sp. FSL H8-0458 TaxID=2975346 RepID=UPI0030F4D01E
MTYIEVQQSILQWAKERSRKGESLNSIFPKLDQWLRGESKPTLKQLEKYAKATSTPLGYFFLSEPPKEVIPVPHYRTIGDEAPPGTSPELIDTLHTMQRRQQFIKEFYIENVGVEIDFIGSYRGSNPLELANLIRTKLGLQENWAASLPNWHYALRFLISKCEEHRIMVMVNGVVDNNTHRKLDVEEFRGFVLVNNMAPLVFINGADAKAAQLFTLVHELAHIWVGHSAIVEASPLDNEENEIEKLCNKAAAEFLCPRTAFINNWESHEGSNKFESLARYFKVSTLVVARRALELNLINREEFMIFYRNYRENLRDVGSSSGGNFYTTLGAKLGSLFTRIVISEVKAGNVMYRDAYRLTGLKGDTFNKFVDYNER